MKSYARAHSACKVLPDGKTTYWMILALRTNVAHWASPFCEELDLHMRSLGVTLIDLPWHDFELLKNDRDHFTARGFDSFRRTLARVLSSLDLGGELFVISDSTIDHNNGSNASRPADADVRRSLAYRGIAASVASQSGSGFCALREQRKSFTHLAKSRLRRTPSLRDAHWLIIGGWNDEWYALDEVKEAARDLVALKTK